MAVTHGYSTDCPSGIHSVENDKLGLLELTVRPVDWRAVMPMVFAHVSGDELSLPTPNPLSEPVPCISALNRE
jgi:hypothetical protein